MIDRIFLVEIKNCYRTAFENCQVCDCPKQGGLAEQSYAVTWLKNNRFNPVNFFASYKISQLFYRVEIVGGYFRIIHRDAERLFGKKHQLEHAGGIDNPFFEEGGFEWISIAIFAEEDFIGNESGDLLFE